MLFDLMTIDTNQTETHEKRSLDDYLQEVTDDASGITRAQRAEMNKAAYFQQSVVDYVMKILYSKEDVIILVSDEHEGNRVHREIFKALNPQTDTIHQESGWNRSRGGGKYQVIVVHTLSLSRHKVTVVNGHFSVMVGGRAIFCVVTPGVYESHGSMWVNV